MIKLTVEDFGPIRSAKNVEIRPLTVFVGPNNCGKSYLAMLVHALCRTPEGLFLGPLRWPRPHFPPGYRFRPGFSMRGFLPWDTLPRATEEEKLESSLRGWLDQWRAQSGLAKEPGFQDLPPDVQQKINQGIERYLGALQHGLKEELIRSYGVEVRDLARGGKTRNGFKISMSRGPLWSFEVSLSGGEFSAGPEHFDRQHQGLTLTLPTITGASARRAPLLLEESFSEQVWEPFAMSLPQSYYFPAARSGILHSHKALAASLVRQAPLVGLREIAIPRLTGVIADFMAEQLELESRITSKELAAIATEIEQSVLRGTLRIEADKTQYPEIYYESDSMRFALHRVSSMVSELAPIILFLKHKVNPGDLVIIEEPESHLHPGSQLKLAAGIVSLVNANVMVLLTTHSDFLLEQISNFLKAGRVGEKRRQELKLGAERFLKPEQVAAYLFKVREGASDVQRLGVSEEDGIPDDEFAAVTEELYEQSVRLQD